MKVKKHIRSKIIQNIAAIVREYDFYVFFSKSKKRDFLRFLKCHFKKNVKNVAIVIQVFTLLHFEILTDTFAVKHYTYMSCYTCKHYVGIVHFLNKI